MYIDTHAHLDDNRYKGFEAEVIKRAKDSGVKSIIIPASNTESSQIAQELANSFSQVYFAAGIHCHEADSFYEKNYVKIKNLLKDPKSIAVGEVGLDYHYDFTTPSLQKHVLKRFLDLALKVDKPLILHCREAEEDLYNMLKPYDNSLRGVIHCYTGGIYWAEKFLELGFYLGFTGIVTFKKSKDLRQVLESIPIERILTETDSPYMTPEPYRSKPMNEPAYVRYVAEAIAKVKGVEFNKAGQIFIENAEKCFGVNFK